jgi:hypothetical protein
MSDDTFSYDDAFPGRWLHSPELKGKPWTLRISRAYREKIRNPKSGKAEPRVIFAFANPKTGVVLDHEYVSSKTNAFICKTAFGDYNTDWIGHLITIASVPCDFSPHGSRVSFVGSPDIDHDIPMITPGDRRMTFKKIKIFATDINETDPATDPVVEPDPDEDPAPEEDDAALEALDDD